MKIDLQKGVKNVGSALEKAAEVGKKLPVIRLRARNLSFLRHRKKTEKHLLENTIQFSQRIIKKRTSAFQIWS